LLHSEGVSDREILRLPIETRNVICHILMVYGEHEDDSQGLESMLETIVDLLL